MEGLAAGASTHHNAVIVTHIITRSLRGNPVYIQERAAFEDEIKLLRSTLEECQVQLAVALAAY